MSMRAFPAGCLAMRRLADRGGGDPMAQTPQLALDSGVAPRPVFSGQPKDQLDEFLRDRRPPRRSGLAPLGRDEALVPTQHCARGDQPVGAEMFWQQPDQRGEQCAVGPVESRPGIATT